MENMYGFFSIDGHNFKLNAIKYIGPIVPGTVDFGYRDDGRFVSHFSVYMDTEKLTIVGKTEEIPLLRKSLLSALAISENVNVPENDVSKIPSTTSPVLVKADKLQNVIVS